MSDRPTKRSRTIASQACDSCRQRKIRCDFNSSKDEDDGGGGSAPGAAAWPAATVGARVCRGCEDVGIPCTFNMPVKRRGPPSKLAKVNNHVGSPDQPPVENSPQRPGHESHNSASSNARASYEPGLQSPYSQSNGMQLPPIQDHSPSLFHLRYTGRSPNEDVANHVYPTDRICGRPMFEAMIQDFLDHLYPLVPIVHKTTFCTDLRNGREFHDPTFLSLIIAMSAALVAHIPSRFYFFRSAPDALRFESRTAMVDFCHDYVLRLKRPETYDFPTQTTWAASYCLAIAYVHLGTKRGRTSLINAEHMQQAFMLEFHKTPLLEGLNCIERQLRRKAFWLCFFGYVHQQIDMSLAPLHTMYQAHTLEALTFDSLLPLELDDEYILSDSLLHQPADQPSLTIGFNANCRTFWASVTDANNRVIPNSHYRSTLPPDLQLSSLQTRLQRVKHALDLAHPQISQWNISSPSSVAPSPEKELRKNQWESMRANIHVGHLWLQSMLFEHIVSLSEHIPSTSPLVNLNNRTLWSSREDICRQLLNILYNISAVSLEPNGNVLVNKIRGVATTLLDCPFEQQGDISRRANKYITNFAELLAGIDKYDMDSARAGQQYWSELDGYSRRGINDFNSEGGSVGKGSGV